MPSCFDEALEIDDLGPERDEFIVQPKRLPAFGAVFSPQRYEVKRHLPSLSARLSTMPHIQEKSTATRGLKMRKMLILVVVGLVGVAGTASAGGYRWTPTKAAARVKATYTTVDTVRRAVYEERLKADLAAGIPESDPRVIRDRKYIAEAIARPDKVTCTGVGRRASRYSKFHCTAHVTGTGEWASGFHVVQKLTVTPSGAFTFSWTKGWR